MCRTTAAAPGRRCRRSNGRSSKGVERTVRRLFWLAEGGGAGQQSALRLVVRFSRAVGKNLGPFFEAWGVPTSTKAHESIRDLPEWVPRYACYDDARMIPKVGVASVIFTAGVFRRWALSASQALTERTHR